MNRIPTEGLKHQDDVATMTLALSLNEQNPDRGIETAGPLRSRIRCWSLNEQNPDRGIETVKFRGERR